MLPLPICLLLYNLLLIPGLLFLLPGAILKMRRRGGRWSDLGQRLGSFSAERLGALAKLPKTDPRLWIHAVSVGEVGIARKLIDKLLATDPSLSIVLTTTTPTGQAITREIEARHSGNVVALLNPVDFPPVVSNVLKVIAPTKLILVEAEVWPNLVTQAKRRGIPTLLVNARLSHRSERRYHQLGFMVKPVFAQLHTVLTQEPEDSERWRQLGPGSETIHLSGSIKFDPDEAAPSTAQLAELKSVLHHIGVTPETPILLAASTHRGEEADFARVFQELQARMPDLIFLLAPRHVERTEEIAQELDQLGLTYVRRSQVSEASAPAPCLLIDTTGELRAWQKFARVVVVGKSFHSKGGQNPAEAVMSGAAVVFGPHMENFEALAGALIQTGGAQQVADMQELTEACGELLQNPDLRVRMVEGGLAALRPHQGATRRTAQHILAQGPETGDD
jgi:3-deoxy-D-manno-octulosonic-acid transferase